MVEYIKVIVLMWMAVWEAYKKTLLTLFMYLADVVKYVDGL